MKVRIWGVRGSIPCPGPETVYYGGNTACLEVRFEDLDRYIIIDAGSGIRSLGNWIVKNELSKGPVRTQLFMSHTHWDHIMGFPFFTPIFIPGTELTVYGPVTYEEDGLDKIIGGQLSYRYGSQGEVIHYGEVGEKIEVLKDHAHFSPDFFDLFDIIGQLHSIDYNTSPLVFFQPVDATDQGRFPGPGRAADHNTFFFVHSKVDSL